MISRNRTTAVDGTGAYHAPTPQTECTRPPLRCVLRAMLELARSHRRLHHVPTLAQVRALAHLDGRSPSSYLLDPEVNLMPPLLDGEEGELGGFGLCFDAQMCGGRHEFVALRCGSGFRTGWLQ